MWNVKLDILIISLTKLYLRYSIVYVPTYVYNYIYLIIIFLLNIIITYRDENLGIYLVYLIIYKNDINHFVQKMS